jgi:multidrug efflux pump subunit AcrB
LHLSRKLLDEVTNQQRNIFPAFSQRWNADRKHVQPMMGAVMCMGVGTANSILVVSFAKERLLQHGDPIEAAIEAGFTRFRPVLMTALAMIIGMIPMALGLGEGGEQNAPLGRAVIGGLLCATVATLIFVPAVFGLLHKRRDSTVVQENSKGDPEPMQA